MASEVLLPKQGNSVESCIIVEWKKKEGDPVSSGEPILEVETDKATMEVESTADGVLLKQLVAEGDDVPVMTPIAIVGAAGEKVESVAGAPGGSTATKAGPAAVPASSPASPATTEPAAASGGARTGRIAISPRARKLASSRGIDYTGITGTGPGGRIMVRDIEQGVPSGAGVAATSTGESAADLPAATGQPPAGALAAEDVKVTGIRKVIADRMLASLNTTAQLTMNAGADARKLLDLRNRLKSDSRPEFQSVSINDLVLFAVSRVLKRFAELNSTYSDGLIHRYPAINLGFAVDTDRGLMVPVIRNASALSLVGLAAEAHRLADLCKAAKAGFEDLEGGTFTVTNLGVYGIESFTPVLNAPQVGILGVGASRLVPTMADGEVVFIPTIGLSLTIDHQVVDGAPGARFLKDVAASIADIDLTLAE